MYKFLVLVWILILQVGKNSVYVNGQEESEEAVSTFYCNKEWCETAPDLKPCSDIPLNCSTIGFRKMLSPAVCNCCEYCFNYSEEDDACVTSLESTVPPTHLCGPLLQCQEDENDGESKCLPMTKEQGPCVKELRDYEERVESGELGIAQFKPDCDGHGFYNPRQCMPGSICFCMSEGGERIFGVGFQNKQMDCACSRDVERLKSFGLQGSFPHCLPNGDYDEVQCSVYTRRCYCLSKPEKSVAIQNLADLPCYIEGVHPVYPDTPYLRPCELALSLINFEILQVQLNQSKVIVSDKPKCGLDGYYDVIQSQNQKWICSDQDGYQIESFEAEKTSATPGDMNCFCAITRSKSSSSTGKPRCCPNGNYYNWQCSGLVCYCVDKLGRQDMSEAEVPLDEVERLSCFANPCG